MTPVWRNHLFKSQLLKVKGSHPLWLIKIHWIFIPFTILGWANCKEDKFTAFILFKWKSLQLFPKWSLCSPSCQEFSKFIQPPRRVSFSRLSSSLKLSKPKQLPQTSRLGEWVSESLFPGAVEDSGRPGSSVTPAKGTWGSFIMRRKPLPSPASYRDQKQGKKKDKYPLYFQHVFYVSYFVHLK